MKLISKFALLILISSILYLIISGNFFSVSPFIIMLQVLAVLLSIWARRSFKTEQFSIHAEPIGGPMLITGPYKFMRHPMYASALILIWTTALGHLSPVTGVVCLFVTVTVFIRIIIEDQYLKSRYPEYIDYSRRTKRIIPFIV